MDLFERELKWWQVPIATPILIVVVIIGLVSFYIQVAPQNIWSRWTQRGSIDWWITIPDIGKAILVLGLGYFVWWFIWVKSE